MRAVMDGVDFTVATGTGTIVRLVNLLEIELGGALTRLTSSLGDVLRTSGPLAGRDVCATLWEPNATARSRVIHAR